VDLTAALKQSADGSPPRLPGKAGFRLGLGKGLVIIQVSLSLMLLLGAGLFVRTLTNLESVNPGFNVHNLLLFGIDPSHDGYKGQRLAQFYQELTRRVETLPAVQSVSISHSTLIGGGGNFQRIHIEGYSPKPGEGSWSKLSSLNLKETGAAINWIGPKFFETLGIPILLGRTITDRDTEGGPRVVVVNEKFVRQFLGPGNPIGRRFTLGEKQDAEIVGVVGNAKYFDLRQEPPPTIYAAWNPGNGATNFEVRTAGNPTELANAVRRVAQDMDRNVALYDVRSEVEQIDQSLFEERLFARFTIFFGLVAALLACVGIYGIMAFAVTLRTREIGIRMALGASRGGIAEMVLRESMVLVGIGIAIGVLAALGVLRLISSLLYGLTTHDPLTIAIAALVMLGTAALAAYLPARRATKVDPMLALRYE
jgi:predicted permease